MVAPDFSDFGYLFGQTAKFVDFSATGFGLALNRPTEKDGKFIRRLQCVAGQEKA